MATCNSPTNANGSDTMSKWITDRRPTSDDGVMVYGPDGGIWRWQFIHIGEPWKPIPNCEPYVKPNSWIAEWSDAATCWTLWTRRGKIVMLKHLTHRDAHREAAERIAAIYEEVMP